MSYQSLVLVKQAPDTANISGDVMKPDGTVNRSKLPAIFNPEDKVALELALQVRERFSGSVKVMTMGPPKASELLRECLYMGADEATLISDRKFAGALLNIDAFNQPGVEEGKIATYALMDRKGYEQKKKEIEEMFKKKMLFIL